MRSTYKILVGKPEGKRPLGRPNLKWVDTTIRMDIGWKAVYRIHLAQDREHLRAFVNTVMNLQVL